MPRMDSQMTRQEIDDFAERLVREDRTAIDRYYRNHCLRLPRTDGNERCAYIDDVRVHGPISAYPETPSEICRACLPRNRVGGCEGCRPELFEDCGYCGRRSMIGHPCTCWVYCEADECDAFGIPVIVITHDWSTDYFCTEECAENSGYQHCGDCDMYMRGHRSGLCRECRPCDCGDCRQCRDRTGIHSYSYKPSPLFKGEGPLYLGLECEISTSGALQSRTAIAEYVNGILSERDIAYLKSDSSIGNGFELVTHPMSHRWAMEEFPWHLFDTLAGEYGVEESEDCGIHVHASRSGFSGTRHLYLWQKFFYRNERPLTQLARRESDRWAAFRPDSRDMAACVAKKGGHYTGETISTRAWYVPRRFRREGVMMYTPSPNRYSAINAQNAHTLEVRIFAGAVDATPIKAALGLVHASIEYTRTLDTQSVLKKGGWDWEPFRNWVADRDGTYSALNSEIERLVTA